jgi:hypothetical protein
MDGVNDQTIDQLTPNARQEYSVWQQLIPGRLSQSAPRQWNRQPTNQQP